MISFFRRNGVLSWALYDWANSAWATSVLAGFFPIFFKDYWSAGMASTESTFWLGLSISTAGLLIALTAPFLGAVADKGNCRKRLLLTFAALGIVTTGALALVARGDWQTAAALYVFSQIGFLGANIFYDALLVSVSDDHTVDVVSGLGFALGYLGGGLIFAVNVMMTLHPEWFHLIDATLADMARQVDAGVLTYPEARERIMALGGEYVLLQQRFSDMALTEAARLDLLTDALNAARTRAVQWAFVSVSVWWTVFSLPLAFGVKEVQSGDQLHFMQAVHHGYHEMRRTFHQIRRLKPVILFLLAYWFYIDGVNTIVVMAVDYGKNIGITTTDLITALLMVQFVAFPFAYAFGKLGQRFGAKRFLLIGIAVYMVVTVMARNMDLEPYRVFGFEISKFFVLAFMIGTVQGGVQALSRSFYARLIPADKSAEYFGFYNMIGKFAAIIGPTLVGTVTHVTGNPRAGVFSIAALFVAGFILLKLVKEKSFEPRMTTNRHE